MRCMIFGKTKTLQERHNVSLFCCIDLINRENQKIVKTKKRILGNIVAQNTCKVSQNMLK